MTEENKEQTESLTGIVIFRTADKGSKSESEQPFLKKDDGDEIRLFYKDSNPFENNYLLSYKEKRVKVTGKMHDSIFFVDSIDKI